MPVNDTPVFSCKAPIRWGDMDAYGHLNNTVYFRLMEEARVQLVEHLLGESIASRDNGPVIVTAACTFLKPVVYPDTVRIDCYLSEPGRSSFMIYYELFAESIADAPACTGESKVVWVNQASGKSMELPVAIRAEITA